MHKLIYILFFSFLFCKSKNISTEQKEAVQQVETPKKPEKPKFTFDNQEKPIGPGTVRLLASIKEIASNKIICGKQYSQVLTIEIERIINSGSSIVNMLSSNQEIQIGVRKHLVEAMQTALGKKKTFILKEKLCFDADETRYEVIAVD